jgi:hypothetical protein
VSFTCTVPIPTLLKHTFALPPTTVHGHPCRPSLLSMLRHLAFLISRFVYFILFIFYFFCQPISPLSAIFSSCESCPWVPLHTWTASVLGCLFFARGSVAVDSGFAPSGFGSAHQVLDKKLEPLFTMPIAHVSSSWSSPN